MCCASGGVWAVLWPNQAPSVSEAGDATVAGRRKAGLLLRLAVCISSDPLSFVFASARENFCRRLFLHYVQSFA